MQNATAETCLGRTMMNHNREMAFEYQPVLRGARMTVRPLRADDFDALYEVARDPLLWEQHPERNRHRPEIFRPFFDEAIASAGALTVIDHDARVIGSSRFHGYEEQRHEVEIGWTFLARSHWGGATNRELHSLMLSHAFRFVDRVVFLVDPDNLRSQRAHEKLGAVQVGMRRNGAGEEHLLYEISRLAPTGPLDRR